jgi:hypothetical protein
MRATFRQYLLPVKARLYRLWQSLRGRAPERVGGRALEPTDAPSLILGILGRVEQQNPFGMPGPITLTPQNILAYCQSGLLSAKPPGGLQVAVWAAPEADGAWTSLVQFLASSPDGHWSVAHFSQGGRLLTTNDAARWIAHFHLRSPTEIAVSFASAAGPNGVLRLCDVQDASALRARLS